MTWKSKNIMVWKMNFSFCNACSLYGVFIYLMIWQRKKQFQKQFRFLVIYYLAGTISGSIDWHFILSIQARVSSKRKKCEKQLIAQKICEILRSESSAWEVFYALINNVSSHFLFRENFAFSWQILEILVQLFWDISI